VTSGRPLSTEVRFRPPDGRETTVKVFVDAIRDARGGVSGYVGVMVDVTDQRAAEQQLAAASRLAALGTLVAGVGHEINNPLAAAMANDDDVVATLRRLRAHVQGESPLDRARIGGELAEALESAGCALDADKRIARIVKDLVSLGRGGGRRERVQLRDVAEAAIRWFPPAARAGATIEVEDLKAPEVLGHAGQLAQVVLNLVSNAAKAARDGKPPSITVRLSPGRGGGACLEVEDDGAGMAPEVLARVFDPFFSTREPGQGMGLGLSVSHAIVAEHGGTISATSEAGKGSTFRVELPAAT
jgi:signal transduction histidine kinase